MEYYKYVCVWGCMHVFLRACVRGCASVCVVYLTHYDVDVYCSVTKPPMLLTFSNIHTKSA